MKKPVKQIGITGGIGSGKSEVTKLLRQKGYTVIDADEVSRDASSPGSEALRRLRERLGDDVFLPDGSLNRKKLAALMFANDDILVAVNDIFHPDIFSRIETIAKETVPLKDSPVFISVPLLFETNTDGMMDEVWLVTADEHIRLKRVLERGGMSESDIRARMAAQMPEDEKRSKAGVIIENNGTLEELYEVVEKLLNRETKNEE